MTKLSKKLRQLKAYRAAIPGYHFDEVVADAEVLEDRIVELRELRRMFKVVTGYGVGEYTKAEQQASEPTAREQKLLERAENAEAENETLRANANELAMAYEGQFRTPRLDSIAKAARTPEEMLEATADLIAELRGEVSAAAECVEELVVGGVTDEATIAELRATIADYEWGSEHLVGAWGEGDRWWWVEYYDEPGEQAEVPQPTRIAAIRAKRTIEENA